MQIRILSIVITSILVACSGNKKANEEITATNKESKDSVAIASESIEAKNSKGASYSNFQEFWKAFRLAVLNNDSSKVYRLTKFPLETRGPMDSDPIVSYHKNDFPKVFQAFLQETVLYIDSLGNDKETNQLGIIKETKGPGRYYISTNDWARVGNLEFKKVNNEWKLTFAYLEYPTIEEINKK